MINFRYEISLLSKNNSFCDQEIRIIKSSRRNNYISAIELDTKQNCSTFQSAQIPNGALCIQSSSNLTIVLGWWTHVREIPNTNLLVSLNHHYSRSANMEIFQYSQKKVNRIYSFEEVVRSKIDMNKLFTFMEYLTSNWPRRLDF